MAQPSPLHNFTVSSPTSESHDAIQNLPIRNNRRFSGTSTTPNTPTLPQTGRRPSESFSKNFRFPGSPLSHRDRIQDPVIDDPISPRSIPAAPRTYSPRPPEDPVGGLDPLPPVTR